MKGVWVALVASVVVVTAACQSGGGLGSAIEKSQYATQAAMEDSMVTVRVENNDFPDLTVYLLTEGGTRIRLGMANGHTTTVLSVPSTWVRGAVMLRFITHQIGGMDSPVTDPMMVSPGDEIVLTIMPS